LKILNLTILIGLMLILVTSGFSQIISGPGLKVEFVGNVITGSTETESSVTGLATMTGLIVSPVGDIYVAQTPDASGSKVFMIRADYTTGAGGSRDIFVNSLEVLVNEPLLQSQLGFFNIYLRGLAVASDGTVYSLDRFNDRVVAIMPDGNNDGLSDAIEVYANLTDMESPNNLAFAMNSGITNGLYVIGSATTGEQIIQRLFEDADENGQADRIELFASFPSVAPLPDPPVGFTFETIGSSPTSLDLFVSHESIGFYRVLPDSTAFNDPDYITEGIQQISSTFRGSLAFQSTSKGGSGTDLYTVRNLSGANSHLVSRLTFRSNGTIDTFTDVARGFKSAVLIAAGRNGDLFIGERETGNIFRISASSTSTPETIITPGFGLVYSLDALMDYANSLVPGIALHRGQIDGTTYENYIFGSSVQISANDRLIVENRERMVFPGGRKLEIRGGLTAIGNSLGGLNLNSGEFSSMGQDAAFISITGFQQETGMYGINFGKSGLSGKANLQLRDYDAEDQALALAGITSNVGVSFAYSTLTGVDMAGGWEGIVFNSNNYHSVMRHFSVRFAETGILYVVNNRASIENLYGVDNLQIEQGFIDNNHTGIELFNTDPLIRRCVVQRSYALTDNSPSGGGTTVVRGTGSGIYVTAQSKPMITYNEIRENDYNGVSMSDICFPRMGRAGDAIPFKSTGQLNVGHNNLVNNGFNAIYCDTDGVQLLRQYAQFNYWGLTFPADIDMMIFDKKDNPIYSEVIYSDFDGTPNTIPISTEISTSVEQTHWQLYR
jgi:hypothetical protein